MLSRSREWQCSLPFSEVETAIRVSIRIMDAFVAMRRFMVTNAEVFQRLSTMEYHQQEMQQNLQESDKRIESVTESF